MAFLKFAAADAEVLGFAGSAQGKLRTASLAKFGEYKDYRTDDAFLYVRVRAISSRVNKNHDGWPSAELQKSWRTFIGKPIFIDHHNDDPTKARGVVVDAEIHVEDMEKTAALDPYYATAPAEHKPPTWVELLLEVDAKQFPKLAKSITSGDIDGVSMGCNVERSKCSHCGNWARAPEEYCSHIVSKGAFFDHPTLKTSKRSYEDCYDIGFFEISFVFDPADETALVRDIRHARTAAVHEAVQPDLYGAPGDPGGMSMHGEQAGGLMIGPEGSGGTPAALYLQEWLGVDATNTLMGVYQQALATLQNPEYAVSYTAQQLESLGWNPYMVQEVVNALYADMGHEAQLPANNIEDYATHPSDLPANENHPEGTLLHDAYPNDPVMSKTAIFGLGGKCKHCGEELDKSKRMPGIAARCSACGYAQDEPSQKNEILVEKTADQNPLPQSEMTIAPDKVDTLRKEQVCPVCGSSMENGTCEVCNFVEPPEGFDNPNLQKAKEVDEEANRGHEMQVDQIPQEEPIANTGPPSGTGSPGQGAGAPQSSPMPMAASTSNHESTIQGISGMSKWQIIQRTASGPNGGRINTQERPILPPTRQPSDKPTNAKVVSDSVTPVESNTKEKNMATQKHADGATPAGSGVSADKRVDVSGIGGVMENPESGTEHTNVEKEINIEKIHTDTWHGNEGDSLGQHDPVSREVGSDGMSAPIGEAVSHVHTADGAWGSPGEGGGKGFPDHEPTRLDLEAGLLEEVGDPTMTWSGTDGNQVYRQQEPVTDELGSGGMNAPIGEAFPTKSLRSHIFRAMRLAETEVELGLTEPQQKWDRAGELEEQTPNQLDSVEATLARVKTANLRKAVAGGTEKKASRMPSLQPTSSVPSTGNTVDLTGAEELFGR